MDISNFVFVGVGDTSVLFDSLGGVVADFLRQKNFPATVFGGVDFPITTKNIKVVIEGIKQEFPNKKIVIIDCTCASLNNKLNVKSGRGDKTENNLLNENNWRMHKQQLNEKISFKQGKVNIANINYECGDYNILCETFTINKGKILSLNIKEILLLSSRIVSTIFKIFKI